MTKKISLEEFERRIKNRFPNESFTIIKYDSLGKPGTLKCDTCNQEISISKISNFFAPNKAYGCVNCHGLWKERNKKIEEIQKSYEILDTFVKDTHTYYHIKCLKCGHERTSTLKNLFKHLKCGCETGVLRNRTEKEFIEEVNIHSLKGDYTLLSEYKNQTSKVKLKHNDCGFIWWVKPGDVIHGRSQCPRCFSFESKGVTKIRKLLEAANIDYVQESRLEGSLQRFDFYIEKIKLAIEYNGRQHYEEVSYFSSSLEEQQERDQRKLDYCKEKGIELIIIPYYFSDEELFNKIQDIINKYNDYPAGE